MTDIPKQDLAAFIYQLRHQPLTTLEQAEILRILSTIPAAQALCQQLARTLGAQLNPRWILTGNLTEVFAVLDAVHCYTKQTPQGSEVAAIAKRLLRSEAAVGGPYYDNQHKVSLDANAYIANCMVWLAAPLPRLEQFISQALAAVPPSLQQLVIVSRAYPLVAQDSLLKNYPNPAKAPLAALAAYYIACQHSPHTATAIAAVTDPSVQEKPLGRALAVFAAHYQPDTQPRIGPPRALSSQQLSEVVGLAQSTYNTLPEPLRQHARRAFNRLLQVDSAHEITLLPHFFALNYLGQTPTDPALLLQLGAANVHTWLAYTIYDDFLDDEGQPALLSVANVALRAAATAYQAILPDHRGFQQYARAAFTAVDSANSWEIQHWRYRTGKHHITLGPVPDFKDCQLLADRALLHILGPVAVLAADGQSLADQSWQDSIAALRQYLIARQLTDDLHDWTKDLQAGHITYVVAEIVRSLRLPAGTYAFNELLPFAREQFRSNLLPGFCDRISLHLQAARQGLKPYIRSQPNQFSYFLDILEESLQAAVEQQKQSQEFLRELG